MEPVVGNYLGTDEAVKMVAIDVMRETKNTFVAASANLAITLKEQTAVNAELSASLKESVEAIGNLVQSLETVDLASDITSGLESVASEVASIKSSVLSTVKNSADKAETQDKQAKKVADQLLKSVELAVNSFGEAASVAIERMSEVQNAVQQGQALPIYPVGVKKPTDILAVRVFDERGNPFVAGGGGGGSSVHVTTTDTEFIPSIVTTDSGVSTIQGYVKTQWDDQGVQTGQQYFDSEFNLLGSGLPARTTPESVAYGMAFNATFNRHTLDVSTFGSRYFNSVIIENLASKVSGGNLNPYRFAIEQEVVIRVIVETEENGTSYTNTYAVTNGVNKYDVIGRYIKSVVLECYASFGNDIVNNGGLLNLNSGSFAMGQPTDAVYAIVRLERI